MHAVTPSVSNAAAPLDTCAASLRVSSANRRPTARLRSRTSTKFRAAAAIAGSTGGATSEPPSRVRVAAAFTTGRTPRLAYASFAYRFSIAVMRRPE
jgi:hypothetical protein